MFTSCELCMTVNRKPLAKLCQQSLHNLNLETRKRVFPKGSNLFRVGDLPLNVYIIQNGLVKLYIDTAPGHQATVRLVRPGELFGYTSLLSGEPYSLAAEAMQKSEVCVLNANAFFRTLETDPVFTRSILQRTARELRATRLDLLLRAEHDATSNIASHLLELADSGKAPANKGLVVNITRSALGELTGSAQETVSRVLGKLEESGFIERKGRGIFIKNKEGLLALSEKRRTKVATV